MNKITVISLDKGLEKNEKSIKNTALKILKVLNKNKVSVEIYLADARKMRFLNKKFRNKNKTASILSFEEPKNFILPASKSKKLGEIYLNAEVSSFKLDPLGSRKRQQVSGLLAHGLLHLLGYKHSSKSDRIKMERKEKYVSRRL